MPSHQKGGAPDNRLRIDLSEDRNVSYWAKKFGVSDYQLRTAVAAVGANPQRVAEHLIKRRQRT